MSLDNGSSAHAFLGCQLLFYRMATYSVANSGSLFLPCRDSDPSPPSSAEVKNRVDLLYLLSLRAFVVYERVKHTCSLLVDENNIFNRSSSNTDFLSY
jgi:hypothetical protein